VPWWILIPAAIFAVLVIGGTLLMVRSLLALSQAGNRFQAALEPVTVRLQASTEELDRRSSAMEAGTQVLNERKQRIQGSIETLRILNDSLEEVRTGLRLVRLLRAWR
jgi:hypothetical protein